jgi:acyl dehydratase
MSLMTTEFDFKDLKSQVGKEIHVSPWISINQEEIIEFGRVTRDPDPLHVDPAFAEKSGPFGTPVLFGFQILSMLSHLCQPLRFKHGTNAVGYDLNYGFNRVRFITPVPVDALFRNHVVLKRIQRRKNGDHLLTTTNTIELKNGVRPALIAEWLGLISRRHATTAKALTRKKPTRKSSTSRLRKAKSGGRKSQRHSSGRASL